MTDQETCHESIQAVAALRANLNRIYTKRRPRVLIVEDSVNDAALLKRQIDHQCVPTDTEIVNSCEEALPKIKEGGYDLVFLDLRFPRMTGVQLLEQTKTTTPFIAISGLDPDAAQLRDALEYGAIAVFRKPFADEQLRMICGLIA